MTDKVTIQPKSKPEKTTISISGETSERLEIYCRANGILRKEFVSLALEYFERTGFDLKSNALDYSPLEKIIGELNEVKATMQTSNEGTEAIRQTTTGSPGTDRKTASSSRTYRKGSRRKGTC